MTTMSGDEGPSTGADRDRWDLAVGAIGRHDVEAVAGLLAGDPGLARLVGPTGRTLLGEAARALTGDHAGPPVAGGDDNRAIVGQLLDAGADPALGGPWGWTPLHSAAISGLTELARLLLDAGAPVDAVVHGTAGATPLSFAEFYGHRATAELLARDGPVPDDLRAAAGLGDMDRLRRWLDRGRPLPGGAAAGLAWAGPVHWFPPRSAPPGDQTVLDESLTWAARSSRIEAMELLVAHGADVDANPYRGTALLWATYSDAVDAAAWLLDRGADPNRRHDCGGDHGRGATALHLAAQYGCMDCLRLLLDRGADPHLVDDGHGATAIGWARYGEQSAVIALLEAHAGRDDPG
jgi:ankyrin repeat protein